MRDKAMRIENNDDKEVFNGDIGRITGNDEEAQELTISFDGHDLDYEFADLDEVIHRVCRFSSQSSSVEYAAVVIPVLTQYYMLLQRNLIYTGITGERSWS